MILRTLSAKLKGLSRKFPIVTVVGPRQSGKTTLVKAAFPEKPYVSLEDLDQREFAEKDPRGFLDTHTEGTIVDEIQRVPSLFSYLQSEVDAKDRVGQYVLTGSQNFLLEQGISQSLAGRTAILKLLPLSLQELSGTSYEPQNLNESIFKGFYPRLYDKKISPHDWYSSYVQTYVEKDVRLVKNITDLGAFQRFIKLCAGRTGQILNLSSLGNECGITHNTAKSWISLLESTFIVFLLNPYHRSFNKRLIKLPKLHFYDTGLACYLLGIENSTQMDTHYLRGGLFESFVISEIFKRRWNHGLEPNCFFWRDKLGNEIDCVTESAGKAYQIEIKSSKTISDDSFMGLKYWEKLAGKSKNHPLIIYGGDEDQKRSQAHVFSWRRIPDFLVR